MGTLIDDTLAACPPAVDREQIRYMLETIEANYGFEVVDTPIEKPATIPGDDRVRIRTIISRPWVNSAQRVLPWRMNLREQFRPGDECLLPSASE